MTWRNWAGNQSCEPARVARPRTTYDLVATVHVVREGIDPQSYVRDYRSGMGDQAMTSSVSGAAPSAAYAARPQSETLEPPGILEDNTFVDAGTSDFVSVADDPLFT
jgi:hypothetical protein